MDTRPPRRLEPFEDFSRRVKACVQDDLDELFRLTFGRPISAAARSWRDHKSGAVVMERHGRKKGLWRNHTSGEAGNGLDLFALAYGGEIGAKGAAYVSLIEKAAAHYGASREGAGGGPDAAEMGRRKEAAQARAEAKARADEIAEAAERARKREAAAELVRASVKLDAPEAAPARRYLEARRVRAPEGYPGLRFLPAGSFPDAPRFNVAHPDAPALLLILRAEDGRGSAVQRITLEPDGRDRDRERGKLYSGVPSEGSAAPFPARAEDCTGGALILAEGLESSLACWTAAGAEVWSGVDAGGLARLIAAAPLDRRVIVASDRDAPGNEARRLIDAACAELGGRHPDAWRAMPTPEQIPIPEPDGAGKLKDGADAADVLKIAGPEAVRAMIAAASRIGGAPPEDPPPRSVETLEIGLEPPAWMDEAPPPEEAPDGGGWAAAAAPKLLELPPEPEAAPIYSREEAPGIIREGQARFIAGAVAWRAGAKDGPPPVLVQRVTAGGGKTAGWMRRKAEFLRAHPGKRIASAFMTQDQTRKEFEAFRAEHPDIPAAHRLGRLQTCPETGRPMCARQEEAAAVQTVTRFVQSAMCEQKRANGPPQYCRHFHECPYQKMLREVDKAAAIFETHGHLSSRTAEDSDAAPEMRAIDEDPIPSAVQSRDFSPDFIRKETRAELFGEKPRAMAAKEFAGRLTRISDAGARMDAAQRLVLEALEAGGSVTDLTALGAFLDEGEAEEFAEIQSLRVLWPGFYPKMSPQEARRGADRAAAARKESGAHHLAQMWRIIAEDLPRGFTQRLHLVRTQKGGEEHSAVWLHYLDGLPRDAPLLVLDATAAPEIIREIWPEAEIQDVRIEETAIKIQVYDRSASGAWHLGYPTSDAEKAEKEEARARGVREDERFILEAMAATLGGPEHIAFAAPSAILRAHLEDAGTPAPDDAKPGDLRKLKLGDFALLPQGPFTRGLNDHAQKRGLLLGGRLMPPPHGVETRARAIFRTGEPVSFKRGKIVKAYPARAGASRFGVELEAYLDPRAEAAAASTVDATQEQTAGRLRTVHRDAPALIINLCNRPLPGFIPDLLISFDDLAGPRARAARAYLAQGGAELTAWRADRRSLHGSACSIAPSGWPDVLDLSAEGLSLAAPDIFATAKAAKSCLEGASRLRPLGPIIVSYRAKGPYSGEGFTGRNLWGEVFGKGQAPEDAGRVEAVLFGGIWRPADGLIVAFRRAGQRGKESRVWCNTCDPDEARDWIERRHGALLAFRVAADLCAPPPTPERIKTAPPAPVKPEAEAPPEPLAYRITRRRPPEAMPPPLWTPDHVAPAGLWLAAEARRAAREHAAMLEPMFAYLEEAPPTFLKPPPYQPPGNLAEFSP